MARRALGILAIAPSLLVASSSRAGAAPAAPEIDLKIQVSVPTRPVAAGSEGEAVVTLTPPDGIHLNQYPPIRLTIDPSPPLVFAKSEVKIGLDTMPEDIEKNPFETIDPIRVKFRVGESHGDHVVPVKGKLRYYYCVVKSGYCAPGVKTVSFKVPITSSP